MKECRLSLELLSKSLATTTTTFQIAAAGNNNNNNNNLTMPCWYYDKKDLKVTPSVLDGISFETERRYRKEGARFIMNCGTNMGLGHNTMATGVVYFHRFYMFHSFKSFPRYVTACCCLFLAGKVEETPKKCKDIIKTARSLLTDAQFYSFGDDPKEEVMTLERILLQTIKFDLQVEHPYTFLLKYAKCFKGDQQKLQKMVQMAWNFVNDSLSTVVCLQWEPEIIAVALIHLASKLSKFTVVDWIGRTPHHLRWWDMFVSDVTMEILEDICHQVLDLYQTNQRSNSEANSPPQNPPSRAESPTPLAGIISRTTTSPVMAAASTTTTVQTLPPPPPMKGIPISAIGSAVPSIVSSASGGSLGYMTAKQQQQQSTSVPMDHHEANTIPSTSAIKPLPPPPDLYMYPAVNSWVQASHYPPPNSIGPTTTVPPPLPPPTQMYGGPPQFTAITGHYSAGPPPMLPGGHRPPGPHVPPLPAGSYYSQQQPPYGRQRYPPS